MRRKGLIIFAVWSSLCFAPPTRLTCEQARQTKAVLLDRHSGDAFSILRCDCTFSAISLSESALDSLTKIAGGVQTHPKIARYSAGLLIEAMTGLSFFSNQPFKPVVAVPLTETTRRDLVRQVLGEIDPHVIAIHRANPFGDRVKEPIGNWDPAKLGAIQLLKNIQRSGTPIALTRLELEHILYLLEGGELSEYGVDLLHLTLPDSRTLENLRAQPSLEERLTRALVGNVLNGPELALHKTMEILNQFKIGTNVILPPEMVHQLGQNILVQDAAPERREAWLAERLGLLAFTLGKGKGPTWLDERLNHLTTEHASILVRAVASGTEISPNLEAALLRSSKTGRNPAAATVIAALEKRKQDK